MSSIEVVDVNTETKTEEAPINNEVVEQNETVNKEPTPEEVKPEEVIPEPKAKAKALPRTKKEVELVQCEHCSKKMTLKSLRHSHPKNCKGEPTELSPVNPQKNIRKIKLEVKEEIKNEIKQEVIEETIKKPTATELFSQHYEELKQRKQDKQEQKQIVFINVLNNNLIILYTNHAYEKS